MRNFAIAALSFATAISGVSPAYAYPTMSANGSSGGLVIEVVDHGHDWKAIFKTIPFRTAATTIAILTTATMTAVATTIIRIVTTTITSVKSSVALQPAL